MSVEQEVESLKRSLTIAENAQQSLTVRLDSVGTALRQLRNQLRQLEEQQKQTKGWEEYYGRLAFFWDTASEDGTPIGGAIRYLSRATWDIDKGLRFFADDLIRQQREIPHGWKHCKVLTKQTEAMLRMELNEGPSEAEI